MSGVFDTFILSNPVICSKCSKKINEVQSKNIEYFSFNTYYPYDVIQSIDINISNIVEEQAYCRSCSSETKVYIVIKNGIYIGTSTSIRKAKKMMNYSNSLILENIKKKLRKQNKEKKEIENKYALLKKHIQIFISFLDNLPIRFFVDIDENKDIFTNSIFNSAYLLYKTDNNKFDIKKTLKKIIENDTL
jgi:hypothetical protein